jgi:uncharacterized protein
MNTGFQLYQLQEIDSAIDKANRRIKDIEKNLIEDIQVKNAKEFVEKREAEYLHQKILFNSLNDEIQSKKNKKTQSESSLYNGKIVNPKELQDLQKEISSLNSFIASSEDELLSRLVELENSEKEFADAKELLKIALSKSESQKALFLGEKNQLTSNISSLNEKRESLVRQFDPVVIETYNKLRISKNGIAVAKLVDDACSSCGALLTANQCQQARSQAKLVYCPNCGRILFGS